MYRNFDVKALEQQYSPSSCVEDIAIFIEQYISLSKQALAQAKAKQVVHTNLRYGKDEDEVIDLFLPTATAKKKLHVYIHGGYWQELSKNESSFAATNFQQQGVHFAVINYSLAPKATLTEIVEQCRKAIEWLYMNAANLGYNADDIHLSGSSAGGHLAIMMAITDWSNRSHAKPQLVQSVCAVSGIYDLTPIQHTYINQPLQLTEQEILQNSPLLMDSQLSRLTTCRIILAYGDNETPEFKRQSQTMHQSLLAHHAPSQIKEIPNRNHFDVIVDLADADSWLSQQAMNLMNIES